MGGEKKTGKKLQFKYVYPDDLRDFYVNGAWGGTTPRNEIYMHLYSERQAIPKNITYKVLNDKSLGEAEATSGANVVRLIQSSVVMDANTAIALRDWLDKMIKAVETAEGRQRQ